MGAEQSHASLEVQFSNKTQNFTLKNPRTHFWTGDVSTLSSEVLPASSTSCKLSCGSETMANRGLLLYEVDSFALILFVHHPKELQGRERMLSLKLYPLEDLSENLDELMLGMMSGKDWRKVDSETPPLWDEDPGAWSSPNPEEVAQALGRIDRESWEPIQVTAGPLVATAITTQTENGFHVEVVLEEQGGSGQEETPQPRESRLGEVRTCGAFGETSGTVLEPQGHPENPKGTPRTP